MQTSLITSTLPDVLLASASSDDVAVIVDSGRSLTYGELGALVDRRREQLSFDRRSVVVLAGTNSIEWVVNYLALLADRHVPLLAGGVADRLIDHWKPAAVVSSGRDGWTVERFDTVAVDDRALHPDLALLMSTSGSTGSPKLVRLSTTNLISNATSIADFQGLTAADTAITNLPLHYSMGLSVLHSHLAVGASVVVTDNSVVDACFARALHEHSVTNVAGVPHTFDLLEQAGAERVHVPSLRFLAQAGGRMDPSRVVRWVDRAAEWGVDWFAMYGQTEATARMTYVPPSMVRDHPGSIGVAIPGGEIGVETFDDSGDSARVATGSVGEIVYRGPNVMLGYAVEPDDLAASGGSDVLRTGDLGRVDPDTGLLEVVGRRARRIKPFGLRIDLDDVERRLAAEGIAARVAGDDDLVVVASAGWDRHVLAERLVAITGLPESRVVVVSGATPLHENGKIDYGALLERGRANTRPDGAVDAPDLPASHEALASIAAEVLGRTEVDSSQSFVALGGDSLSYVECSVRFERIVGPLPSDWHLRPLSELAPAGRPRRLARVDTTVLLRSIGILAVVSTHMRLWHVPGGAHLMLGVAGYNIARFLLPIDDSGARLRAGVRTLSRVAIPTVLWTLAFMALAQYTWTTLTLVNNYIGPRSHEANHWHFWFVEVFVHLVLITTLVYAIPIVRRADVRWPYAFPLALLALTIVLRMEWADMGDWYNLRFRTHAVAWFFVLGWLVHRSSTWQQKIVTTVICLAAAPGVFQNPRREYFIAFGFVVLVWARDLPLPRPAVRPMATLAAASMWIFISHFMIWPPMKEWFIVEVAYPLTIAASLGVWWAMTQAPRHLAIRFGGARWSDRGPLQFASRALDRVPDRVPDPAPPSAVPTSA